jgi:Helicase conserved C-terminal domain
VMERASLFCGERSIAREARRAAIAAFNSDPVVRVMVANDAAGEGVNLQRGAHLMVNYDLPWNLFFVTGLIGLKALAIRMMQAPTMSP